MCLDMLSYSLITSRMFLILPLQNKFEFLTVEAEWPCNL